MIGLSLPLCFKDVLNGKVSTTDVELIYSISDAATEEEINEELRWFSQIYWRGHSDGYFHALAAQVFPKVKRIRLNESLPLAAGHWVKDSSEIIWQQPRKEVA